MSDALFALLFFAIGVVAAEMSKRRQARPASAPVPAALYGQAVQFIPGFGFVLHRGELVFGRSVADPARFSTQLVMGCVGSPEASA